MAHKPSDIIAYLTQPNYTYIRLYNVLFKILYLLNRKSCKQI